MQLSAADMDASALVPLVRAKKLAPWLLPPQLAALAAPPPGATEPAKLQLMCEPDPDPHTDPNPRC